MKLIVGLGNPGEKYRQNRHNVGFITIDTIYSKISNFQFSISNQKTNSILQYTKKFRAEIVQFGEVLLLKPQTFMNKSGEAVQKAMQFYRIEKDEVFIIHDDLDIRLGEYKLSKRGPKIHNGVNSVRKAIGEGFWYVRIGVDNRHQLPATGYQLSGREYVLGDFLRQEREVIDEVIEEVGMELMERLYE